MDDIVKNRNDYEATVVRNMQRAHAADGTLPVAKCPHPISAVEQFVDDMGYRNRYMRPTNLFQCTICNQYLCLVDFHGREAKDG